MSKKTQILAKNSFYFGIWILSDKVRSYIIYIKKRGYLKCYSCIKIPGPSPSLLKYSSAYFDILLFPICPDFPNFFLSGVCVTILINTWESSQFFFSFCIDFLSCHFTKLKKQSDCIATVISRCELTFQL